MQATTARQRRVARQRRATVYSHLLAFGLVVLFAAVGFGVAYMAVLARVAQAGL